MKISALITLLLPIFCGSAGKWIAEDESGAARLSQRDGTLEIVAPRGLTLRDDCRIRYDAAVVSDGGEHDRLADLNCFRAASAPNIPMISLPVRHGESDGYFGLRLLSNHTFISGFKIEYL